MHETGKHGVDTPIVLGCRCLSSHENLYDMILWNHEQPGSFNLANAIAAGAFRDHFRSEIYRKDPNLCYPTPLAVIRYSLDESGAITRLSGPVDILTFTLRSFCQAVDARNASPKRGVRKQFSGPSAKNR
jgi:hypothetical protein